MILHPIQQRMPAMKGIDARDDVNLHGWNNTRAPEQSSYLHQQQMLSVQHSWDSDSSSGGRTRQSRAPKQQRRKNKNHNRDSHGGKKQVLSLKTLKQRGMTVAMDCEMVGTGQHGKQSSLARVTIVNWYGTVLFDEFIRQDNVVTDYRTFVSGITPQILETHARMDLETCRFRVQEILADKILVGHGLKNDLRALGMTHPWHMTRDTAKYEPFMKVRFNDGILWPRGLKELAKTRLFRDIQVTGKPHCPYEDAMTALDLYRLVSQNWEKVIEYKINKTREIQQHHHGKE